MSPRSSCACPAWGNGFRRCPGPRSASPCPLPSPPWAPRALEKSSSVAPATGTATFNTHNRWGGGLLQQAVSAMHRRNVFASPPQSSGAPAHCRYSPICFVVLTRLRGSRNESDAGWSPTPLYTQLLNPFDPSVYNRMPIAGSVQQAVSAMRRRRTCFAPSPGFLAPAHCRYRPNLLLPP